MDIIEYEIRKELSRTIKEIDKALHKKVSEKNININDIILPEKLKCYRQGLLFSLLVIEKFSEPEEDG